MHIYLVICLIKTILNAVYNIIKDFINEDKNVLNNHGKNCHLNFGNDKNQVTFFYYVVASGSLHLVLFFYSLNWTKIIQIFPHIHLSTTFLLPDELFIVFEQLRLTTLLKRDSNTNVFL